MTSGFLSLPGSVSFVRFHIQNPDSEEKMADVKVIRVVGNGWGATHFLSDHNK
jgi:hypothetical protein